MLASVEAAHQILRAAGGSAEIERIRCIPLIGGALARLCDGRGRTAAQA
jgi:hypothetical protein